MPEIYPLAGSLLSESQRQNIAVQTLGGQERALKGKSCRFIGGGGGAQNEATSALGGLGQHRTEKKRQESWASLLERDGILGFW